MGIRLQSQATAAPTPSFTLMRSNVLQRRCACAGSSGLAGECTGCSRTQLHLQRRVAVKPAPSSMSSIVHDGLRAPGQPLDAATRAFFEPRFGHDFSQVRVHADAQAHDAARAVNALAYTVGGDIVLQRGAYQPFTVAGQALLAHELTHTIQQGHTTPTLKRASGPLVLASDQSTSDPIWRAVQDAAAEPAETLAADSVWQRAPAPDPTDTEAFPVVNAELVLDPAQPQRCCTCGTPPCVAHLGPAVPGDPTAQNGMNLVATILHTIASSTRSLDYGFVQTAQARRCLEFLPAHGGGWTNVLERPAGSNDVFDPCATCTTPRVRDTLPEIVFSDAPGFAIPGAHIGDLAFGNQIMQQGNFQTWVIAREARQPWHRISEPVRWHSRSWMRRDAAGNWELNPGHNQIGPGWTRFGAGCPP